MPDESRRKEEPVIPVELQLHPELSAALGTGAPLHDEAVGAIRVSLAELVGLLGVPGEVAVHFGPLPDAERSLGQWIGLRVNGRICRYADDVLLLADGYASERIAAADGPADLFRRLREVPPVPGSDEGRRTVEFLTLLCTEIVSRQPAVLWGEAQSGAYLAAIGEPAGSRSAGPGGPSGILGRVLDLRVSIADTSTVSCVLRENADASEEIVIERLVDALAPGVVELQVPESYIGSLGAPEDTGTDLLTFACEGMYEELGIVLPPFRVTEATGLKRDAFRFRLNHLCTAPIVGLREDECLANETPERLRLLGVASRATVNPSSQQPGAVVDRALREELESAGCTVWDRAGYCILCLAESLRRNAAALVSSKTVQIQMEQLAGAAPELVAMAYEKGPPEQLSHLLRDLVSDTVPVRDLQLVVERFLDHELQGSEAERVLLLDDRPFMDRSPGVRPVKDVASFVRSGLRRQIGNAVARSTSTVVAYLLDPELEREFEAADATGIELEDRETRLLVALAEELRTLPLAAWMPSLLTGSGARASISKAVRQRYPKLRVISYADLPPGQNVQPVARIASPHAS